MSKRKRRREPERTRNPSLAIGPRSMLDDPVRTAIAMARALGCTCDPEVTFYADAAPPFTQEANVAHDSWCPLLRAKEAERRRMAAPEN